MVRVVSTGAVGAVILATCALGCATRGVPLEVSAMAAAGGEVRLHWRAADATGFVVERRVGSGPWESVADLPPEAAEFTDANALPRELHAYRVAVRRGTRAGKWSAPASAVPVFTGKPLHGWLDASRYEGCSIRGHGAASALQCALEDLGGRTEPGADPAVGPHVLWLPAGDYPVKETLWLEGRAGIQIVGDAGASIVRWDGPPGAGPDATRVLFHAEGNRDSFWRGLVWDGGCADPATCFVVAFDQSFCGRTDLPILRSESCGARALGWPERPDVGESDNGSAHVDSVFRNAWIGLRAGHHGVADDSATYRRCSFLDNFVGAALEDFNALRHWFWDGRFERNYVGLSNNVAEVWKTFEPDYAPGRCAADGPACYSDGDCAGRGECRWRRRWAGDYAVFRGRFSDNALADLWAEATGEFVFRDSESHGSGSFLIAGGPNATPGRFSLIGNRVSTPSGPAVRGRTPGPFLLADNVFTGNDGPAGLFRALAEGPGRRVGTGSIDVISLGNRFSTAEPYRLETRGRVIADDLGIAPPPPLSPAPAPPVDPLNTRPIYTVTGAGGPDGATNARRIQATIDAAAADPRPAVVHLPGAHGRYLVGLTLHIPPDSDLVLAGDGAWTTLVWVGAAGAPLLEVDASAVRRLTVRDLQFRRAGVVVRDLEAVPTRVLLSQVLVAEAATAAVAFEGLHRTRVDVADLQATGGLLAGEGIGVVVRPGSGSGPPAGVRIWSGVMLGNAWDFDVIATGSGPDLLIHDHYMENSRHHLRVRGHGGGRVALVGSKAAVMVPPDSTEGPDDATAVVSIEGFDGNVDLVQSQLFLIPPPERSGAPADDAHRDARIRLGTGDATVRSVGVTLRPGVPREDAAEVELTCRAGRYTRIAGVAAEPQSLPLPDLVVDAAGERLLAWRELERETTLALDAIRAAALPPFYEGPGSEDYRIHLDKVFIYKTPGVGLLVAGGRPCHAAGDCPDPGAVCDTRHLAEGMPGTCR